MTTSFAVRRMLIALDASPAARSSLTAALRVAGRLDADAESVFVEDSRLLELCGFGGLPTAHVSAATGRTEPIDAPTMEAGLRAQADQLARELDRAAVALRQTCRLRSVRGPVAATLIAEASQSDLLVIGRRARHVGAVLEATVRHALTSVLVLPERSDPGAGAVSIVARHRAALDRALAAAARLSPAGKRDADIFIGPEIDPAEVRAAAEAFGLKPRSVAAAPRAVAALAGRLGATCGLVILAADDPLLSDGGLRGFLHEVGTATLMIRYAQTAQEPEDAQGA